MLNFIKLWFVALVDQLYNLFSSRPNIVLFSFVNVMLIKGYGALGVCVALLVCWQVFWNKN